VRAGAVPAGNYGKRNLVPYRIAGRAVADMRPGICTVVLSGHHRRKDMPNRGELPHPARREKSVVATPREVWPIVGFCALGFLISISVAVTASGLATAPRLFGHLLF
jgi:hypothetical protein